MFRKLASIAFIFSIQGGGRQSEFWWFGKKWKMGEKIGHQRQVLSFFQMLITHNIIYFRLKIIQFPRFSEKNFSKGGAGWNDFLWKYSPLPHVEKILLIVLLTCDTLLEVYSEISVFNSTAFDTDLMNIFPNSSSRSR